MNKTRKQLNSQNYQRKKEKGYIRVSVDIPIATHDYYSAIAGKSESTPSIKSLLEKVLHDVSYCASTIKE